MDPLRARLRILEGGNRAASALVETLDAAGVAIPPAIRDQALAKVRSRPSTASIAAEAHRAGAVADLAARAATIIRVIAEKHPDVIAEAAVIAADLHREPIVIATFAPEPVTVRAVRDLQFDSQPVTAGTIMKFRDRGEISAELASGDFVVVDLEEERRAEAAKQQAMEDFLALGTPHRFRVARTFTLGIARLIAGQIVELSPRDHRGLIVSGELVPVLDATPEQLPEPDPAETDRAITDAIKAGRRKRA